MVTHLSIIHTPNCLTSVIWPFTLTSLISSLCLYCALLGHLSWGSYCPFVKKMVQCSPILVMTYTCTIQTWPKSEGSESEWSDHTEDKQQRPWVILRWVTICIYNFFQSHRNIRQIRQIRQIYPLNQNFKKSQITASNNDHQNNQQRLTSSTGFVTVVNIFKVILVSSTSTIVEGQTCFRLFVVIISGRTVFLITIYSNIFWQRALVDI